MKYITGGNAQKQHVHRVIGSHGATRKVMGSFA